VKQPSDEIQDHWADRPHDAQRRLLVAGLELFMRHGFHGTTTRAIASEAGMSPAALYIHYASKSELLFELARTGHASVLEEVAAALEHTGPDPVERIRQFVETFVGWHAEHAPLARVIQYEWDALEPPQRRVIRRLRRQLEALLHAELDAGQAAGAFDLEDLRASELAVLSMGIDVARWFTTERGMPAQRLASAYGALTVRMLGAVDG
jgi:AcrR family transcriptional regulator